jgi:hypothetical protein
MSSDKVQPVEADKVTEQRLENVHTDLDVNVDPETGKRKFNANTQLDDAARLLEEAGGHVEATAEDRKRVLRRIDLFVCACL